MGLYEMYSKDDCGYEPRCMARSVEVEQVEVDYPALILAALIPFPEAQRAVAAALERGDAG